MGEEQGTEVISLVLNSALTVHSGGQGTAIAYKHLVPMECQHEFYPQGLLG